MCRKKDKIGAVVLQMLEKRMEFCLASGDFLLFRMWRAFAFSCMQGLSHDRAPPPTTVASFLAENRFDSPCDEERGGSGYTPLVFAAMSGNVAVVRELIASYGVDVNARVRVDVAAGDFGTEKGMNALTVAAAFCPQDKVHGIVSTLLSAGADVNARSDTNGVTALMCAVGGQSLGGVTALVDCAGETLQLEIGLKINRATALNLAGVMGTFAILEALIHAGADCTHRSGVFFHKPKEITLTIATLSPSKQERQWWLSIDRCRT